jgi:aquaporin Z
MKKAFAEFIGTFALVFIGCGTVVVGGMATGSTAINELAIALAFGLSIVAMAYGIGQISGCHVNPAVSFGVLPQEEWNLANCLPIGWRKSLAQLLLRSCSI